MKVSKVALAAATMLGGSALLATPALAQQPQYPAQQQAQPAPAGQGQQAAQPQRQLNISRAERTALAPLETALRARDWAAAQAALPAAQAAAQGADARYFVARATWQIADGTSNTQLEAQALAQLVALPSTPANELAAFLGRQAELAFNRQDWPVAEAAFVRLSQLTPNDPTIQRNLSIVRSRAGNTSGALEPVLQQIRTAEAAGQRAPEEMYRRAFELYQRAGQRPQAAEAYANLLRAYPTPANWRTGVDLLRGGVSDTQLLLDIYRLARVANVIQAQEYVALAQMLDQAGLPGETKAVLDAGVAAGALQSSQGEVSRLLGVANRRTAEDRSGLTSQIAQARSSSRGREARVVADALYGYQRYAEAAELYRLALSKGGEDTNLVNTRLGATLALAGQRAEAEAALRAVTGARSGLAQLWLTWLASRPA